ncbi:hypothetical protein BYT27DRAFT_7310995 [Phlegmacium glaucopus]|nr:hypothetical protein BYT27DRAFT_7310995 [Phlegmacium glaucopus]
MYAFGRVVGQHWAPMMYSIGNTVLQLIFCLGMIYKMDPFLMPRSFCIAQTIFISVGAYMMTGAAGAISFATSIAVLKPKTWADGGRSLKWRAGYLYPTVVFPVVATIIHTVFIFKFDSVRPSDDLHCDSSNPEWVRFLSYAGLPFVLGLPSLYLSIKSVRIVYKTYRHLQRSRSDSVNGFSQIGRVSRKAELQNLTCTTSTAHVLADPQRREQIVPAISSPELASQQFHLPFKAIREHRESSLYPAQEIEIDDRDSTVSMSFASPGRVITFTTGEDDRPTEQPDSQQVEIHGNRRQPSTTFSEIPRDRIDLAVKSKEWTPDKGAIDSDFEYSRGDLTMTEGSHTGFHSKPRQTPNLAPAVWRIIIFQVAFVSVQFLACISTVIDVATHRSTPTPLGTQHIALLLAAWGPVVVFGHLPAVMRNLIPWRELKS